MSNSNDIIAFAAITQALAAIATAGVTFALFRVTSRYADSTDKMVSALAQERADRIEDRRLPVRNLLRRILQRLDESTVERYLQARGEDHDLRLRFKSLYEAIRPIRDDVRRVSFPYSDNLTAIARELYDFEYVLNGIDQAPEDIAARARFHAAVTQMRSATILAIENLERFY